MNIFKKLMVLIFLIAGTTSAIAADSTATKPSYLFVQTAKFATLRPDKQHPGNYLLTLHRIPNAVTYFTDRPNRISGLISVNDFLKEWQGKTQNNFTQDAPNVDIEGIQLHWMSRSIDTSVVVSLSNPSYNANNETMTYTAKAVKGTEYMPAHLTILRDVALFFDDFNGICYSCCCN